MFCLSTFAALNTPAHETSKFRQESIAQKPREVFIHTTHRGGKAIGTVRRTLLPPSADTVWADAEH